jgi:predicted ATPase
MQGFASALTSFVGRTGEAETVAGLLDEYRMVTVTGPGGVGKTHLSAADDVRVLATSREPTGVSGEARQYVEQSGGVDACGEAEKSLRQFVGGLHGGVVAHAVE